MTTTKRIQHQYGGPELLRLEDVDLPAAQLALAFGGHRRRKLLRHRIR